ncbi:MAG: flagellar motor protein MotB [bacterium]
MIPFLHRASAETSKDNPLWLVVLSAIMTNMMLFFLILYVFNIVPEETKKGFSSGFQKKAVKAAKEKKAEKIVRKFQEKEAAQTISQQLSETGLGTMASVEVTEKQIRIKMASPVLFRSGQARLTRDARIALDALGKSITGLKNEIIVEGHTDNIPVGHVEYKNNWELSAARASAVIDYFSENFKMPQESLIAAAYGESRPLAGNESAEGRRKNRRIEVVILRE